jgi:hypothetical protein
LRQFHVKKTAVHTSVGIARIRWSVFGRRQHRKGLRCDAVVADSPGNQEIPYGAMWASCATGNCNRSGAKHSGEPSSWMDSLFLNKRYGRMTLTLDEVNGLAIARHHQQPATTSAASSN